MLRRRFLAGLAALALCRPALAAASLPRPLADGGTVRIATALDGDTLALDDGRQVRLVGIAAPKPPLDPARPSPLADAARAALEILAAGRAARLGFGGTRADRYGRVLAHLFVEDHAWLQGELVASGHARVMSLADNRALVGELLARENTARQAQLGLWSDPDYRVARADRAEEQIGRFALVEGEVLAAATVRGRGFLNFGPDRRSDFTVTVAPADRSLFTRARLPVEFFAGHRVRVRGWVQRYNGPEIAATHPEQIELLG